MAKMARCRIILLVSLLVLCGALIGIAAEGGLRPLVSLELLRSAKLKMLWQNELPMKRGEGLEQLFVLGERIYALSDRNYFVCLNVKKGNVIFSRDVAPVGLPVVGLELYGGELFSLIGNKLVEINPELGTEAGVSRLEFGVTCPAARNSSYFYLGGSDRRMHALGSEDKVEVFQVAADNDSLITSIVADEDFVVFATDAGSVVRLAPDGPRRLWQFNAGDAIAGAIVRDANLLFVASKDTNVYKINILTGELVWRYQTGALLDRGPRVTGDVVYQYVRGKGLIAIDRKSGEFMWEVAGGVDLLAESERRAYVITNIGELVVMDNKKLARLYSVNFAGVSRYTANVRDSKIYIADKGGRVACLKPTE